MKLNTTYFKLSHYHNQIEEWREKDSVEYLFNRSRIDEFYKNNTIRINTLMSDLSALQKKYFVVDEKGNAKYLPAKNPTLKEYIQSLFGKKIIRQHPQPIMLKDMSYAEYTKELQEIMKRPAQIII